MSERWQNLPFLGKTATRYRYRTGVVPVPNRGGTGTHGQRQSGTSTNQSGTGTHSKKRVGTGTDQNGTSTDTSGSSDFVPLHC